MDHVVSKMLRVITVNGVVDKELKFYSRYSISIPISDSSAVVKSNLRGCKNSINKVAAVLTSI